MSALSAARQRRLRARGAVRRVLRRAAVEPMLASVAARFSREGRLFELKYDGCRMLAAKEAGQPRLRFRPDTTQGQTRPFSRARTGRG